MDLAESPSSMPIGTLLYTVFICILEVFLLCLAGYILAAKGILDKKTQKQLNRLNVSLFTPSLLFSKVAFFLSPAKLRELWIIPIFFVVITAVSMSVSYILGTLFRLKKSQRSFAMAASMFMNSNSLPIALMQSLVISVSGLKWGKDDNKNAMLGRALTYLVLYSTLGMILRWSYGVHLLAQADDVVTTIFAEPEETSALIGPEEEEEAIAESSSIPDIVVNHFDEHAQPQQTRRQSKFYMSFPNSPNQSRIHLPAIDSGLQSSSSSTLGSQISLSDDEAEPLPRHHHRRSYSLAPQNGTYTFLRHLRRRIWRFMSALNDFMTVPLWAALASIIVACIGPVQHALDMHMQPVKGALASAGNCSIPVTLVVLGAYFFTPSEEKSSSSLSVSIQKMFRSDPDSGVTKKSNTPGETKTVFTAVVSRMIITPVLLFPLMAVCAKFDFHAVFEDPVFVVSNVLLIGSPPALTLAQITQAASGDAFERLISRTIFWAYCILTPISTILYVAIGLVFSQL